MTRRRSGSVRFDPYWKVQWYEDRSVAWRDVQEAFSTPEEAEAAALYRTGFWPATAPLAPVWRLMEITEGGRRPLPEQGGWRAVYAALAEAVGS